MKIYSYNIKLVSCCVKSRNAVHITIYTDHLCRQTLNTSESTRTTAEVY
jgi:hypothetical protein